MGQTHTQKYMKPLLDHIIAGRLDPSFVITHRVTIDQAPEAYKTFSDKKDECIKVIVQMQ
jgi:threonine dehydrogenase-like Zn-dependent dehydrogenase